MGEDDETTTGRRSLRTYRLADAPMLYDTGMMSMLHMGNTVIGAGDGFFLPSDAPYAYAAGPEGVEVLEFRGACAFDMQITESLGRWDKMVEVSRANKERWAVEAEAHG